MTQPTIVWFRDDLRLADHPALREAAAADGPVIAVFVLDEESPGIRPLGGAARWWLHHSLASLADDLRAHRVPLVLRRGAASEVVPALADEVDAAGVVWNRRYGGPEREVDTEVKRMLRDAGRRAESVAGSLLFEPWTIRTGQDEPFSVYTPFWKACRRAPEPREPFPAPRNLSGPRAHPGSDDLDDWGLLPTAPDWAGGLRSAWTPGEASARRRLRAFLADDVDDYADARDRLDADGTSRLSPRLRWGELSPFQIWHAAAEARRDRPSAAQGVDVFLSELGWREFAWHVLFHAPDLATENWRRRFDAFPWPDLDADALGAWQHGRTGIPVVDAGMHELWQTGIMHNRVRMVVASFLTKNLLIHWRHGEEWFWDTLVDADAAANPFNWQWVAGSGADAAPYFRVFNPELQAQKFDPDGAYVGRWAPDAGAFGSPEPIVDLKETRAAALAAYERVKRSD